MPRLVSAPTTVVKTDNVQIDEYFGGASCNPCNGDISFAHVKVRRQLLATLKAFGRLLDSVVVHVAIRIRPRTAFRLLIYVEN